MYFDESLLCTIIIVYYNYHSVTGIVYDDDMMYHENDVNEGHPECPERISCIWKKLIEQGIVTCCKRIEARKATEEEILLVHKLVDI